MVIIMVCKETNFEINLDEFYALGLNTKFETDSYGVLQVINNFNHWYTNRTKYESQGVELNFRANKIEFIVGDGDKPKITVTGANCNKDGFKEFIHELNRFFVLHNLGKKYNKISSSWSQKHGGRRYDDDNEFFRVKYLTIDKDLIGDEPYGEIHQALRTQRIYRDLTFEENVQLARGLDEDNKFLRVILSDINEIVNNERESFFWNMRKKNSYLSNSEVKVFEDMKKREYSRLSIWDAPDSEINKLIEELEDFDCREDSFDDMLELLEDNESYIKDLDFKLSDFEAYYDVLELIDELKNLLDERVEFIEGSEHVTCLDDYEYGEKSSARVEEAKHKEVNMGSKRMKNRNPYYGYDDLPYDENSSFPGLSEILRKREEQRKFFEL